MSKLCSKCNKQKSLSFFHKDKSTDDGYYRWCKPCKAEYDKLYRKSEKVQTYYKSEDYKKKKIKYLNENYAKRTIRALKNRSFGRNMEFSLKEEDILLPEFCPLLDVKLNYNVGEGHNYNAASIDRIDNSKGYTKDNIWTISRLANTMKANATKQQLINFSKNVLLKLN